MRASLKFILVFALAIELAFVRSLWLNLAITSCALIYIIYKRVSVKKILWLIIVGLLPFVGGWFMYYTMSPDHSRLFAWIMATRVYAYIFLGSVLVFSQSMTALMRAFEQDLHVNPTFVYGILGALNFLPKMTRQIRIIRAAAKMRGVRLTIFSPQLYVKAIYNAFVWSNNLSQAMYAHGFLEGQKRSHYDHQPLRLQEILPIAAILIASLLIALIK